MGKVPESPSDPDSSRVSRAKQQNMIITQILYQLQKKALREEVLKERFLKTRESANPLSAFCDLCRELGYEIYPMDIIAASEETYAAMKRSTNGGGENSPQLEGEADYYEDFFAPFEAAREQSPGKTEKTKDVLQQERGDL